MVGLHQNVQPDTTGLPGSVEPHKSGVGKGGQKKTGTDILAFLLHLTLLKKTSFALADCIRTLLIVHRKERMSFHIRKNKVI